MKLPPYHKCVKASDWSFSAFGIIIINSLVYMRARAVAVELIICMNFISDSLDLKSKLSFLQTNER